MANPHQNKISQSPCQCICQIRNAAPAIHRRSPMLDMSPAWKRYCIRQKKKGPSCKTSTINSTSGAKSNTTIIASEDSNLSLILDQIKSFSIGSFAGLLGSLAGMGGRFVSIPMMTAARRAIWRGLGLHQHQAPGTSLFAVGNTGMAGAWSLTIWDTYEWRRYIPA
mmetsp:Transcript_26480/g.55967  ORF Transcript_26480/g.55967 Transcript_26480/m.55967 type:complete len:166 (-) Transcript_26480:320-817(-)